MVTDPKQTAQSRSGPLTRRVVLTCGLLIVGIFGGYEIVERLWLRDARPETLYALHLVRGVGASIAIGLTILGYLLKRAHQAFPTAFRPPQTLPSIEATDKQHARWFITLRWVAVVGLLGSTLTSILLLRILPSEALPLLLGTVAGLGLANVAFALALPGVKRVPRFLALQVLSDLLFLTAVLHFSGGIENPFLCVYIFHIVIAAILLPARVAYGVTAVASLLLAALALAEASGRLPHYSIALFPYPAQGGIAARYMPFVGASVSAYILALWVIAYFTTLMSEQLRARERQLRVSVEEIRHSERRLDAVVNSMGAALLLWSKEARLEWCNRTAREWFGFRDGAPIETCGLRPDPERACSDCAVVKAIRTGAPATVERPHVLPEGQGRTLRIQAIPMRGEGGEIVQVLELIQDITEEKAMASEVAHSTKMALLGRMAGAVAHETGNPLSSMAARLELVERRSDRAFVEESVRLLQEQVHRIQRLVTSITRFSRQDTPRRTPCDVVSTLDQVIAMLRMDRRARNIEIETHGPGFPARACVVRDQLIQVFLNLGLNAIDAMPEGGKLVATAEAQDGLLRIVFADTGCGLSPEAKANLFRPFFTTKEQGTGLGLFLSRKFVCDMGGDIQVEPNPGGGCRFVLLLPAAVESDEGTPEREKSYEPARCDRR